MNLDIDVVIVDEQEPSKKKQITVYRKPSQQAVHDSYSVTQSDLNINSHRMPIVARYHNDSSKERDISGLATQNQK